jgi:hypothetical protein
MQRELLALDAALVDGLEHPVGEVQPRRRGSHAALYLRVHRLVGGLVALFGLAVEVWRYGQLAHGIENVGKGHLGAIPAEVDAVAGVVLGATLHAQGHVVPPDGEAAAEPALLPFLEVAHKAQPRATARGLEHLLIVGRGGRLEQEDLDESARVLAEMYAGLNHLGVVENHQCPCGQM